MRRREFLVKTGISGVGLATGLLPVDVIGSPEIIKLTILHTNDVHSRLDPWPMDGTRNQGQGGAAKRAALIQKIRSEEDNVLLFDSGDIFQGTPYFNMFGGEIEFRTMSAMKYDAATIGNHDFDAGLDGLVRQLPFAHFPFIISNYDFSDTQLQKRTQKYQVFKKSGLRIGVFGLGIELKGLVPDKLYGSTLYLDPIEEGQRIATRLRHDLRCDFVICLSHLGYRYRHDKVSDVVLASSTRDIDLILGGHTHTFMNKPDLVPNLDGIPVCINQAGWAGIRLGRIDVSFEKSRSSSCLTCENLWV